MPRQRVRWRDKVCIRGVYLARRQSSPDRSYLCYVPYLLRDVRGKAGDGEYEASVYDGDVPEKVILRVNLECFDPARCDRKLVEDRFVSRFLKYKSLIAEHYYDGSFRIEFNFTGIHGLEFYTIKGRPKRLVDRRVH